MPLSDTLKASISGVARIGLASLEVKLRLRVVDGEIAKYSILAFMRSGQLCTAMCAVLSPQVPCGWQTLEREASVAEDLIECYMEVL